MISLYDLLESSNGQLFGEPAAQLFDDFCLDASSIRENQLFVAIKSEQGDTHQHIVRAIQNGAAGVLCSRPPEFDTSGVSVLLVQDTVDALFRWSGYVVRKYNVEVIAISGLVDKSVTAAAIAHVLGMQQTVYAEPMEGDAHLSIPLALASLTANHRYAVLRLASELPDGPGPVIKALQPVVAVITTVNTNEPAADGQYGPLAQQALELIHALPPTGLAVLNADDAYTSTLISHAAAPVVTVGITADHADIRAENVRLGLDGTLFDLVTSDRRCAGQWTPLLGRYGIYSVLMAVAAGQHYRVSEDDALKLLEAVNPLPGRMNALRGRDGIHLIDNTHTANPGTTLAALDWLAAVRPRQGRVFLIAGDASSPSKNYSATILEQVVARTASVVDVLITRGTEAAAFARSVLECGMDRQHVHITHAIPDVVNALVQGYTLTPDDIVLVQGGAASRMEKVVQALLYDQADRWQLIRQDVRWVSAVSADSWRLNWLEIDSDALASNTRAIKTLIGPDKTLLAVVKADAYGHGAVVAARTALRNGAEYLGVSSMLEAAELRAVGIDAPILVMNYTPEHLIPEALRQNITVTIYDLHLARAYNRTAARLGQTLRVHIKVDTGMGRIGVMPDEALDFLRHLMTLTHLEIEGIFTHFSSADGDPVYTTRQIESFRQVLRNLQASTGVRFKYVHAANSAGTIAHPEAYFNMVRVGAALYGIQPSDLVRLPPQFRPVMSWKTVVAQVKTLPPGHPVGYGNTYITSEEERIAILSVGYADGFRRGPNTWREVLINGQRAPVIGRVSMEKSAVRVTHIAQVTVGDEVVLVGRQQDDLITVEEIATWLGTSSYEMVCSILPRAPRR